MDRDSKFSTKRTRPKILVISFISGVLLTAFLVFKLLFSPIPFQETEWRNAEFRGFASPRYRMSGDLVRRLRSSAIDRKNITEMLGPPDQVSSNAEAVRYRLGGGLFTTYYLFFRFEPEGKVASVAVVPD